MVNGGHAIVLDLELNQSLINVVDCWVKQDLNSRKILKNGHHCTIAFIGRNMPTHVGEGMINATIRIADLCPTELLFNAKFSMFGRDRDKLVGLLDKQSLMDFRSDVIKCLAKENIFIYKGRFSPHVTLAEGNALDCVPRVGLSPCRLRVKQLRVKIGKDYRTIFSPTFFPCGCALLKVRIGRCDVYDKDGNKR